MLDGAGTGRRLTAVRGAAGGEGAGAGEGDGIIEVDGGGIEREGDTVADINMDGASVDGDGVDGGEGGGGGAEDGVEGAGGDDASDAGEVGGAVEVGGGGDVVAEGEAVDVWAGVLDDNGIGIEKEVAAAEVDFGGDEDEVELVTGDFGKSRRPPGMGPRARRLP